MTERATAQERVGTPEEEARELLKRAGVEDAQSMSSGDLVELANLLVRARQREEENREVLFKCVDCFTHGTVPLSEVKEHGGTPICPDCSSVRTEAVKVARFQHGEGGYVTKYDRPGLMEGEATPRDASPHREGERGPMLRRVQREVGAWAEKHFGVEAERDGWQPLLVAMEELGELAHAHIKEQQGIRTDEPHRENARDACADVVIALANYCDLRGFDLHGLVESTWEEVRQRDWSGNPESAHLDARATPQREGEREPVAWRWRLKDSSMGWMYYPEKPTDIAEPHDWEIQPLYAEPGAWNERLAGALASALASTGFVKRSGHPPGWKCTACRAKACGPAEIEHEPDCPEAVYAAWKADTEPPANTEEGADGD